jgi:hypothetical protein
MNQDEHFFLYLKNQAERKQNYQNNSLGVRHIINVICHKKKKSDGLNEKVLKSFDGIASIQLRENMKDDLHSYEIVGVI